MYFVRIWEKIDRLITEPHGIINDLNTFIETVFNTTSDSVLSKSEKNHNMDMLPMMSKLFVSKWAIFRHLRGVVYKGDLIYHSIYDILHIEPDAKLPPFRTLKAMAYQFIGVLVVCSNVCSGTYPRHQSSASLAFVRGIHRWIHQWPVDSHHKGPLTRKMFPFDNVMMQPYVKKWTTPYI